MNNSPIAFDCTLRDGSYLNNYNFSPSITKKYLIKANTINLKYCELGHGLGLGAYRQNEFRSFVTDKSLINVVNSLNLKTKVGFFAQPKFINFNDLNLIVDSNVDFIRLGVIPENFKSLFKPIEFLSKHNKKIFVFFMQTLRDTPNSLKKKVQIIYENYGIRDFYIVDSTGSMFFNEIYNFYDLLKTYKSDLKIGFHGHNNLGIANSNTFKCLENGFSYLDATLMGIGRGAGNACLEHLIINYSKKFKVKKKDIIGFLKISNFFRQITKINSPNNSHNTLCGIMKIHEQNLKDLKRVNKLIK